VATSHVATDSVSEASGKSTVTAKGVSPGGEAALPRPQGDFLEKKEIGRKTPP